jgi:hypothetical protein
MQHPASEDHLGVIGSVSQLADVESVTHVTLRAYTSADLQI